MFLVECRKSLSLLTRGAICWLVSMVLFRLRYKSFTLSHSLSLTHSLSFTFPTRAEERDWGLEKPIKSLVSVFFFLFLFRDNYDDDKFAWTRMVSLHARAWERNLSECFEINIFSVVEHFNIVLACYYVLFTDELPFQS